MRPIGSSEVQLDQDRVETVRVIFSGTMINALFLLSIQYSNIGVLNMFISFNVSKIENYE